MSKFVVGQKIRYRPGFGTYGYEDAIEADGRVPGIVIGFSPTRVRVGTDAREARRPEGHALGRSIQLAGRRDGERLMIEQLTPDGDPPSRGSRWCPRCCLWMELRGRRRCFCGAAVVRQTRPEKSVPGELRPGIIAEFDDPRDRYDPKGVLAAMRGRLAAAKHS